MNRFSEFIYRYFLSNCIHKNLYPEPTLSFSIREYQESDRIEVLEIYNKNAKDRFPENHFKKFEEFLDNQEKSYYVVELPTNQVIASGGLINFGSNLHALCYGLVHPDYQGQRVGSTLTLARLVLASKNNGINISLIHSVPKSIKFYEKFGYAYKFDWFEEKGVKYPSAVLIYGHMATIPISAILKKRGHQIQCNKQIYRDKDFYAEVTRDLPNTYNFRLLPYDEEKHKELLKKN